MLFVINAINISRAGTVQAKNFKFGKQIQHDGFLQKKIKIRSKRALKGSHNLLLEFWDPLHILGTVQARNVKFGKQIDLEDFLRNKIIIRTKEVVKGSRGLLL